MSLIEEFIIHRGLENETHGSQVREINNMSNYQFLAALDQALERYWFYELEDKVDERIDRKIE